MANRNREYIDFLKQRFDETKFIEFISDLLNLSAGDINTSIVERTPDQKQFRDTIEYYKFIANYESNSDKIGTFIVKLTSEGSQNARAAQRAFISTLLSKYELDASIVAFYQKDEPSWRLSFVKKELSFTDKGIKIDLTPAKRFSYLVGENESVHTAQEYLFSLLNIDDHKITLSDIEKVFDVEKVTKKFFEEYKEKYLQLKEFLDNNEDFLTESRNCDFTSEEFAKKLMGQIVFLYFLQKKGWLGVQIIPDELSEEEYNNISNSIDSVCNNLLEKYYIKEENSYKINKQELKNETIKENINSFVAIFKNSKYDKAWGTGDKQFVRNMFRKSRLNHRENFFDEYLEPFFYSGLNKRRENQYFTLFNCKVPFLNGGLFEPLNNYRWASAQFNIPDEMFSNDKKDGILDIFDLYNFTIDEEEPLEKDIAVDPEMLGKIFENLLDVKERQSTGSFYTPREIVHYMCQESLANYITNKLDIPYQDIINFIRYGDIYSQNDLSSNCTTQDNLSISNSIVNNIINIDLLILNIKIADPAVGSGAFPLGMLNELVKMRENISRYISILISINLLDPNSIPEELAIRDVYSIKRQTIENSIYAVDLEPSAVDIAKLRLWLSLIVDFPNNKEPQPLPNLDCKIIQGNSLVDKFDGIPLFDETLFNRSLKKKDSVNKQQNLFGFDDKITVQQQMVFDGEDDPNYLIDVMLDLQKRFFSSSESEEKRALKNKIDQIQYEMIVESLKNDNKRLHKFNIEYKKRKKNWMVWNLEFYDVFKKNSGFDIVIGNPPYVGEDGNRNVFEPIKKSTLGEKFYMGKMDLLYFFFHLALNLINKKGIVAMITTNYYITADGALKLREDFKDRSYIRNIINFNEYKIFESAKGQHNMITILTKDTIARNEMCRVVSFENKGSLFGPGTKIDLYDINHNDAVVTRIKNSDLYFGKYNYLDIRKNYSKNSDDYKIINYLKNCSTKLSDIANVNQGVVPGAIKTTKANIELLNNPSIEINDGIYVLDMDNIRDKAFYLSLNNNELNMLRPYFKNSDIGLYKYNNKVNKWLIYADSNPILPTDMPNIYNHFQKFKPILTERLKRYNESYLWTSLHRPRVENIFKIEKILIPYRAKVNAFAYCNEDWFFSTDCYCITSKGIENLKYILALLNSKPYYIWYKNMGKVKGDVLEFMPTMLNETPIINMSYEDKNKVIQLSEKLCNMADVNYNTAEIKEIDKIIMDYINN